MKFFSPIPLRPNELYPILLGLNRRACPILAPVAGKGLVSFYPVRVQNVLIRSFDAEFIGNPSPLIDLPALENCEFPYVFEIGGATTTYNNTDLYQWATQYDQYILGGIRIPRVLRNGDILLASRVYPSRYPGLLGNDMCNLHGEQTVQMGGDNKPVGAEVLRLYKETGPRLA